jgi:hypothetical protein
VSLAVQANRRKCLKDADEGDARRGEEREGGGVNTKKDSKVEFGKQEEIAWDGVLFVVLFVSGL